MNKKKQNENNQNKDDENKFSVRTDLAIEATELLSSPDCESKIDGIEVVTENHSSNIKVTWVKIKNKSGSLATGKPIGNYITIESEAMKENDAIEHENIIKVMSENLAKLKKVDKNSLILVVGLGNRYVTPDALGPKVVSKVLVTRHITSTLPEQIDSYASVRPVSAISPGVMGITGIETGEIIKGIVDSIKPDLVIAVDALAARRSNRINSTIQMSDTGVTPGSGVGNRRMAIDEQTLGIPVIAIGVPTVVDAATLVNDTMDRILSEMIAKTEEKSAFYKMLEDLEGEEKYSLIKEILNPYVGNMFVTPKEVDSVINRLTNIISNAINIALHPAISKEDINRYFN